MFDFLVSAVSAKTAEHFQNCIWRVHATCLEPAFRFSGLVLFRMKSSMEEECGTIVSPRDTILIL